MGRIGKPGRTMLAAGPLGLVVPEERLSRGIVDPGGLVMSPPRETTPSEIERLEDELFPDSCDLSL